MKTLSDPVKALIDDPIMKGMAEHIRDKVRPDETHGFAFAKGTMDAYEKEEGKLTAPIYDFGIAIRYLLDIE